MFRLATAIILLLMLFSNSQTFSQELLPANKHTLDSIKKSNKGKVLLLNFWATWCKPCVEEFPDLIKINKKYKDSDFKLVFVTLDFGDALGVNTKKFLKKNYVDFTTYYNGFEKDDELINYMNKDWDGAIPGTFIFDKSGILKKTFIGKKDYEDFDKAVKKLLK
ncbi:MAG: TlpA disulfide reductase family protein [Ignavibacteria bacterium]